MPRRSPLSAFAAATLVAAIMLPGSAAAQGIGFSITPSVEEVRWGEDLLIPNTVFPGGLLSAHFGRFVSLDAHYFRARATTVSGGGDDVVPSRWGGDIRVVLSPSPLAPFVRAGAGVLEFRPDVDGATPSRHLTTSLQGGVRIAVRDRMAGEVTARRMWFRAGPGSGVVEDDGSLDPYRDFSNWALGLGLQVPIGGTWNDPDTDEAVRNLRTLTFPVRVFGGALDFSDALGLDRHPVMGALVGADFGPFVGANLYAFGSAKDGLGSPEQLYGYGLEGSFNLVRRGAWATPHLLLGGGRLHLTEEDRIVAGLDERRTWTATVGGGVDFRITDRLRGELAARSLVLSQRESTAVTSPDQLRSNWLYSGGVRWVIGGGRAGAPRTQDPPREPLATTQAAQGAQAAQAGVDGADPADPAAPAPRPTTTAEDVQAFELERDRLIRELEVERLRIALARLRDEGDAAAAERLLAEYRGDPLPAAAPRSFEVPVLEQGEIRVRFGPEGAADSTGARAADAQATVTPPAVTSPTASPPAPSDPRDPRVDRLLESVARLEGRLEELAAPRPAGALTGPDVRVEVTGAAPGAPAPGWTYVTREVPRRGVLRGDPPNIRGLGIYAGGRLDPRDQTVIGLEIDVGSALGGSMRFRPDVWFGVTDGLSWGVNAHVEWPLPVHLRGIRPTVGGGLGVMRDEDVTRIMIPNLSAGVTGRLMGRFDGFLTYQTLDMFDDRRLVAGIRLRPGAEPSTRTVTVQVPTTAAPGFLPAPAPAPAPTPATPDPGAAEERAAVQGALQDLRDEVGRLRAELSAAEAAARTAEARRQEVEAERRAAEEADAARAAAPSAGDVLLERLRPLERLESVQSVRRVARGIAVVVGGGNTFGVGNAELSTLAHGEIAAIAQSLVEGGQDVSVEGHTDSTGTSELNQRLSQARAEAVRAALLAHGVTPSRVSATGFGQTRPVAGNATVEGRAANRRVEIVVLVP